MTALIGVYRDRATAHAVATELHDRLALPDDAVRVDDPHDSQVSIEAEMDAEVAEAWGSAGLGAFVTAEMMRGVVIFGTVCGVAGAVFGVGLGFFLYDSDVSALTRVLVGALLGGVIGSTVGAVLGGGLAMRSPEERLAAEHGIPVAVEDATPEAEELMARFEPIRLDRFEDGQRVDTPTTEGASGIAESIGEFRANVKDSRRRG